MLYAKNAKIYLAARSEEKANQAIEEIKGLSPNSTGELVFLKLDLDDLEGIKASAESFLAKETKLDILFNNAGVMGVLPGPVRTKQGHEVNLGTNVIAPFLFTHFLTPTLISTAKTAPKGSVRVVWTSSFGTETSGVKSLGMSIDDLEKYEKQAGMERYAQSKAGGWLLGVEYARRFKDDGVASFAINPGNLMTNLAREHGWFFQWFLKFIVYEPFNGTCTLLYAGFSQDLGLENSGAWGKFIRGVTIGIDANYDANSCAIRSHWNHSPRPGCCYEVRG